MENDLKEKVLDEVKKVIDPEIGLSLFELGLIYSVDIIDGKKAEIKMSLTSMACPAGPELKDGVFEAADSVTGIEETDVEIVWTPQWDPATMASEDAKMHLGIF